MHLTETNAGSQQPKEGNLILQKCLTLTQLNNSCMTAVGLGKPAPQNKIYLHRQSKKHWPLSYSCGPPS